MNTGAAEDGREELVRFSFFDCFRYYSFTVNLGLEQIVIPARNQDIKLRSPTWSVIGTGASLPEDLDSDIEKYVKILVDRFIEQYKSVNIK